MEDDATWLARRHQEFVQDTTRSLGSLKGEALLLRALEEIAFDGPFPHGQKACRLIAQTAIYRYANERGRHGAVQDLGEQG